MQYIVQLIDQRPPIALHPGAAHRKIMLGLFFGACAAAGLFALLPGRFLGDLLWKHTLGLYS